MKTHYQMTLLALSIATLTACGGGGGGSSNPDRGVQDGDQLLQLMQSGLYEFEFSVGGNYDPQPREIFTDRIGMNRERLYVKNGTLTVDSHYLTDGGWIENILLEPAYIPPPVLALTESGWQDRASAPCTLSAASAGVLLNCVGSQTLFSVDSELTLANKSLASLFTLIADNTLTPLVEGTRELQARNEIVAATAALTAPVGDNAKAYRIATAQQNPELTTSACLPTAANQPVESWSCESELTSISWEELSQSQETFDVHFIQMGEEKSARVYLEGDLVTSDQGEIILAEDYSEEITAGNLIGSWQKLTLHGQTFIRLMRLTRERDLSETYEGLAIANGRIVNVVYKATGGSDTSVMLNSAAAAAISDAAVGIFPLGFNYDSCCQSTGTN